METADSVTDLKGILRARVVAPLDRIARQTSLTRATQAGALVAVLPSSALDGIFIGLRGLWLLRQIAELYGLRPGISVTLLLLRRIALTAAGVAGAELLAQSSADALHEVPVGQAPCPSGNWHRRCRTAALPSRAHYRKGLFAIGR
jgi:uncharacterized membrane protein YcjF (UPF0283 family)